MSYLTLLNADGSLNRAAYEDLLASKVLAEINLRLCGDAGLWAPSSLSLGDIPAWRAEQVKARKLGPLSDSERAVIARDERERLDGWVVAMQVAAAKQREGMNEAALAAE